MIDDDAFRGLCGAFGLVWVCLERWEKWMLVLWCMLVEIDAVTVETSNPRGTNPLNYYLHPPKKHDSERPLQTHTQTQPNPNPKLNHTYPNNPFHPHHNPTPTTTPGAPLLLPPPAAPALGGPAVRAGGADHRRGVWGAGGGDGGGGDGQEGGADGGELAAAGARCGGWDVQGGFAVGCGGVGGGGGGGGG